MSITITEIKQGTRIRFRDADYDPDTGNYWVGTVNGDPFLTFQDTNGKLSAWVPTYVSDSDKTIVVAGENIAGIEA